jgi:hypothetical protein
VTHLQQRAGDSNRTIQVRGAAMAVVGANARALRLPARDSMGFDSEHHPGRRAMKTVVAVFADRALARDAMDRLEALGVARERMSLHEQDDRDRIRTGAAQLQGGVPDDSGGFLSWLFGDSADGDADANAGDTTRSDYGEAFRRGHMVLGIRLAGELPALAAVAEILRGCDALSVEQRAGWWPAAAPPETD